MKNLKMKQGLLLVAAVFFTIFSYAQDAAEKINQANEALKAKDYAKAYTLYDEAMSNIGDVQVDASINYNIGYAACESGNVEGAVKYMTKAIEAGVNVSKCHENLADLYVDKKDYTNALASYDKAIATSTENTDALIFKAASAAYNGNALDKSLEGFNKSIQSGYKGETAMFYKATILKKQGKDADYKATLEEGVVKYPGDAKIGPALAKVYVNEGNELYKKGAAIVGDANKKVTAGSMKTSDPAYIAEVEKSKVEFKAAIVVLEKAKALDATNKNVQTLLDACAAASK
jgi:tetratricopeptide (TPR) repeat protein